MKRFLLCCTLALAALHAAAAPQPLRQLVSVEGLRDNQLIGYGLVVGLNGSGDSSQVKAAGQSVGNLLKQFGVKLPEKVDAKSRNVATVMVSATYPAGYRRGQTVDVTVASLGDAKSLRGGVLLLAPLQGADGEVYALAQGNLVVGGVSAQGQSGSSVTVNTPTGGRIPNGATIEREIASDFGSRPSILLSLKRPSFQTATRIVEAINARFGASPCCSTRKASPCDSKSARRRSAMVCSARSVVVSTKQRPPSARAQRAASVATATGWPGSFGLGNPAGMYSRACAA